MIFKDPERYRKEFWEITPKLRLILCDAALWASDRKLDFVITCLMRSDEEQRALFEAGMAPSKTSVHMYGRGADARVFPNPNHCLLLSEYINTKYTYDVTRPKLKSLIIHEGNASHFHFQSLT